MLKIQPEPWEIRLIRKIDNVVLAEISKQVERGEPGKREIDVRDVEGLTSFMAGLRARNNANLEQ